MYLYIFYEKQIYTYIYNNTCYIQYSIQYSYNIQSDEE